MEPAGALTTIALGVAALMPGAKIKKEPIHPCVYLASWHNNTGKEVYFEQVEEVRGGIPESSRRLLLALSPGFTAINREVKAQKCSSNFSQGVFATCIKVMERGNIDCDLALRFKYFKRASTNFLTITMRHHVHTRHVTASCPLFEKAYEWDSDDTLQSMHLILNGSIAGQSLTDSQFSVQEVRFPLLLSLTEIALRKVSELIRAGILTKSDVPQDVREKLEMISLIQQINKEKLPEIMLYY